ncbi:MAG: hypothetical protein NWE78_05005 [Candidatus Bathyarchaeota archaeon]|nr:hypothetical protein [Candidatus Bathyarchaeota archaeon]
MSNSKTNEMYEKLLEIFAGRGHRDPTLSLNYEIEQLSKEGKTREKAILTLYRGEMAKIRAGDETRATAERRLKELEKELDELRNSVRNRADEVESIKKYLAYTHRLTTTQGIARILFYVVGALLIVLSFLQYNALTVYIRIQSGLEWVYILDCFVTFSLGLATIALGWVLESMARSRPVL